MSEDKQKITEKRAAMFSSARQDWATPQDLFDELNEEFHFNLDPCANAENHKCERYFTEEDNGLLQEWGGIFRFLQSTIRRKVNGGMDRKVLQRKQEARIRRRYAYSGANRYEGISQIHIQQSGSPFHKRAFEIRRQQRRGPVPFYVGDIPKRRPERGQNES